MTYVYPIIIKEVNDKHPYSIYIPDFDTYTQADKLEYVISVARDCIGALGISYQDMKKKIPVPKALNIDYDVSNEMLTLIDINFDDYRNKLDNKMVRRNVTLEAYLDNEARKRHINVSAVLQEALRAQLML